MDLPFYSPEVSIIAAAAILLDSVAGGTFVLRYFPGPDRLISLLLARAVGRLNKPDRSERTRLMRGAGIIPVFALPLWGAGIALNMLLTGGGLIGQMVSVMLLATILGQRTVWDLSLGIAVALEDPQYQGEQARFGAARWAGERIALRYADGLVANLFFFLLLGFPGLLVFRLLSLTMALGAPSGLLAPTGPFFAPSRSVFRGLSLIPSVLASLFLAIGIALAPGGHIAAFKGLTARTHGQRSLPSRRRPLMTFAYGFGLNFRIHPDQRGDTSWIGPEAGRARFGRADLRRMVGAALLGTLMVLLGLVILAATLLV